MNIKVIASGKYIPKNNISNEELEKKFKLENGYIFKRTGIKNRNYVINENIEEIALKSVKNLLNNKEKRTENKNNKIEQEKEEIGLIITATTTTNKLMPGISNYIQKQLQIENCICLDILAGCGGYINALDIAQMYIEKQNIKKALIIGVDILSKYISKDVGTSILLADGAGSILIEGQKEKNSKDNILYYSNIKSQGKNNEILVCESEKEIYMNGTEIYKYAVKETVKNINELLEKANKKIEDIKYIVPHQSNLKIINSIAHRLKIKEEQIYVNIENIGNTFCASIPIALNEMLEKKLLKENDEIILLGYGGGLNTGSILLGKGTCSTI